MVSFRAVVARFRGWFVKTRLEERLDEELRTHFEMLVEGEERRGKSHDEAMRLARLRLGGLEQTKESVRDVRAVCLEGVWRDLRHTARMLRRSPGFAVMAIITLAVGIGANVAVFSLVDRLLLRTLPVKSPQTLLALTWDIRPADDPQNQFSYPDYVAYRNENGVFSDLLAFSEMKLDVGPPDHALTLRGALVSTNYFDVLGVGTTIGRTFLSEEQSPVAVISYGMWRRWFGSSPDAVGRSITVNRASYVVIGVAGQGFSGAFVDRAADLWIPLGMRSRLLPDDHNAAQKNYHWLNVWGRLKPGVGIVQARSAMNVLAHRVIDPAYAAGYRAAVHHELRLSVEPVGRGLSYIRRDLGRPLALLMAVVGLILLIASINISSLLLARTMSRHREMAIRRALGASRYRLVVQLLMEGVVLCVSGGAAGVLVANWMTQILLRSQPNINPATTPLAAGPDARILFFALSISAISGLVSGSFAAIRCSKPDLINALKSDSAHSLPGARRYGLRHVLVGIQVALSVIVLLGAALLIRNLTHLFAIDPAVKDVFLITIDWPTAGSAAQNADRYLRLAQRLRSIPGIKAVSASNMVPFGGASAARSIYPEGYEPQAGETTIVDCNLVAPGYHELLGTPILQGRGFMDSDRAGSPPVAVINHAFASLYFPGHNPIGKKLWTFKSKTSSFFEVIGVAGDRRDHDLRDPATPHMDLSILQGTGTPGTVYIHTAVRGERLLPVIQRELKAADPRIKLGKTSTLEEMLSNSLATDRMLTILTTVLAITAFSIVVIGLYALIAHSLSVRTRELGIRMALGAPARTALMFLVKEAASVAVTGLAAGLVACLALARFISGMLFEIRPMDPPAIAIVSLLVISTAVFAGCVLGRRAARIDPLIVIRYE